MKSRIAIVVLNSVSTRTLWLTKVLNGELFVIKLRPPYLTLPLKILELIRSKNISSIVIQLPPGPPLVPITLYKCIGADFAVVADVHTGFLTAGTSLCKHNILNTPTKPFLGFSDIILLHNETNILFLPRELRRKSLILYDPFFAVKYFINTDQCEFPAFLKQLHEYAVYPASWHPDEPIEFIARTWIEKKISVPLIITGKPREPIASRVLKYIRASPGRVILSGYIEKYGNYLCLLSKALFVISASTSHYDMQCSAYEALALNKPILALNTLAMRVVLRDGPLYFEYNAESLYRVTELILDRYDVLKNRLKTIAEHLRGKIIRQIELLLTKIHEHHIRF